MRDRLDHHGMNNETELATALRALPGAEPPADAWAQLAARTRQRRTTRRILWTGLPAALAAGVVLFAVWPHAASHRAAPAPTAITTATTPARSGAVTPPHGASMPAARLADLQASSTQWQAWVHNLDRHGAPLDGRTLAGAVALQDRIGLIDLQLSAARNPATTADLWQQRITLLQQLGLLHLQPYLVADQARPAHTNAL